MDTDQTDERIVNALLEHGEPEPRELAAEIGIAAATVDDRLEVLEAEDVIEGYGPTVDYDQLGYDVTAVFQLSIDGDGLVGIVERLEAADRMVAVYEVTGSADVVAVGKFTDTDEMNRQIKDLVTDPDVRAVDTGVVLNAVTDFEQFPVDVGGQ